MFKTGTSTSIGMTIGRMDQEDATEPANMMMSAFGQRMQVASGQQLARARPSPSPQKRADNDDPLAAFIRGNNEANKKKEA